MKCFNSSVVNAFRSFIQFIPNIKDVCKMEIRKGLWWRWHYVCLRNHNFSEAESTAFHLLVAQYLPSLSLSLFVLFCKRTPLSASCNGVCVFVCLFAKMSVIFQLNQTPTWMQYNVLFLLHRCVDCSGHSCLKVTVPRFPGIRPSLESMKLHSGYWLYFSFCSVSGKIKRRLRAKPWRIANMLLTYEQPGHC